jgi:hypothetical protein
MDPKDPYNCYCDPPVKSCFFVLIIYSYQIQYGGIKTCYTDEWQWWAVFTISHKFIIRIVFICKTKLFCPSKWNITCKQNTSSEIFSFTRNYCWKRSHSWWDEMFHVVHLKYDMNRALCTKNTNTIYCMPAGSNQANTYASLLKRKQWGWK